VVELTHQVRVYRHLIGARMRADWQYRTSFVLFLLGQALVAGLDFAVIAVIFSRVDVLAGWSALEVAVLYGTSGVSFGLGDLFVSQVERVATHIRAGTFDLFLLRPIGPLVQLSGAEFALRRIGRMVQPLVVLCIALPRVDVTWGLVEVALVPVTVLSGAVIFGAIWVLTSSVAFWLVDTQEVANAFTYGGSAVTAFPLDVLGGWLRRIVTFAVPLAFVSYVPVARLLGKPPPLGLPEPAAFAAPAVATVLALVARQVWRVAIRHHRSTGS